MNFWLMWACIVMQGAAIIFLGLSIRNINKTIAIVLSSLDQSLGTLIAHRKKVIHDRSVDAE